MLELGPILSCVSVPLGPLLFLIFMNDLEDGIFSRIKFVADDTSLYSVVKDPAKSARELNGLRMNGGGGCCTATLGKVIFWAIF